MKYESTKGGWFRLIQVDMGMVQTREVQGREEEEEDAVVVVSWAAEESMRWDET